MLLLTEEQKAGVKTLVQAVFECCDSFDETPVGFKAKSGGKLTSKEVAKTNLSCYLLYLSASDGKITEQEAEFLNDFLELNAAPEQILNLIKEQNIYSTEFEEKVPEIANLMVEAENLLRSIGKLEEGAHPTELLLEVYDLLGKAFIICDGAEQDELTDFEIYNGNLKRYIEANRKKEATSIETGLKKNTGRREEQPKAEEKTVIAPKKKM